MAAIYDEIATTEPPEILDLRDVASFAEFVEGRAADW